MAKLMFHAGSMFTGLLPVNEINRMPPRDAGRAAGFMFQEPGFAFDAAAISREGTVCPNHPMTRHDNANRIETVR
jgi:hypothetical protein